MPGCVICLPSIERHRRRGPGRPQDRRPCTIDILNDDALLNVFYLYPQDIAEAYADLLSLPDWDKARWWYKLAHVCQRWRRLIFASPARLGLHLVCTYGTPVADMLAHSPPLPLVINFMDEIRELSVEDEEAILLALQDRARVRRIGFMIPATSLLKPIMAMDGQFPILESLFLWPISEDNMTLMLPTRFQAPHLRVLSLTYVVLPMRSPLLTTLVGIVSLGLWHMPPLAHFHPSNLVARLASMPQLEGLSIGFKSAVPTREVEGQHTPIVTHTLPNLRMCFFQGVSAYLDRLLARIITPLLEVLHIRLYNQLTFTVPHLLHFMGRTENLRIGSAKLSFYPDNVILTADNGGQNRINPLGVEIGCRHVDWQVSAAAQIFNALVPALSVVERLSLSYEEHDASSEQQHNEVGRTQWREVLRPFSSVKVLQVADGLIKNLSRSLQPDVGEPPLELLPQLKELVYYKGGEPSDAFTSFLHTRQNAGHPVAFIHTDHPSR